MEFLDSWLSSSAVRAFKLLGNTLGATGKAGGGGEVTALNVLLGDDRRSYGKTAAHGWRIEKVKLISYHNGLSDANISRRSRIRPPFLRSVVQR